MAHQPEEEETAGARALRPPLWLLCLVACWLLGAGAEADFSILDEAQVLASQMRRLAVEELGVVTMQVSGPRARQTSRLSPLRKAPSHSPVQVPWTVCIGSLHAQSLASRRTPLSSVQTP